MLQNRVDPDGQLHAVPERMGWYGNKGCLHDEAGRIRRFHQGRRWITCVLSFKGRRRPLLQPGRYTELFFLDEATAYAAGHRPCAECRRAAFNPFRDLWQARFAERDVAAIDARLHSARWDGKRRRLHGVDAAAVPVGAMIRRGGDTLLHGANGWHRWSFSGYTEIAPPQGTVTMLTPLPLAQLMAEGLPVQNLVDGGASN